MPQFNPDPSLDFGSLWSGPNALWSPIGSNPNLGAPRPGSPVVPPAPAPEKPAAPAGPAGPDLNKLAKLAHGKSEADHEAALGKTARENRDGTGHSMEAWRSMFSGPPTPGVGITNTYNGHVVPGANLGGGNTTNSTVLGSNAGQIHQQQQQAQLGANGSLSINPDGSRQISGHAQGSDAMNTGSAHFLPPYNPYAHPGQTTDQTGGMGLMPSGQVPPPQAQPLPNQVPPFPGQQQQLYPQMFSL